MSMKKGNWIPVSRKVVYDLSPVAGEGQYSEQSAYLSLREDLEKNNVKGLREYARIWRWHRCSVSRFFDKIGYKTGDNLTAIKVKNRETIERQSRDNRETLGGTLNYIVYNDLDDAKKTLNETILRQSRDNLETHTYNPNPNPNPFNEKESELYIPEAPAEISRRFFSAYADAHLRDDRFDSLSERLGKEIDGFVEYWTERNASGKKERWETVRFFEIEKRIESWMRKTREFNNQNGIQKPTQTADERRAEMQRKRDQELDEIIRKAFEDEEAKEQKRKEARNDPF